MLRRFIAVVVLLLPLTTFAEDFVVGKDYELINSAETSSNTTKIPVTEFFSYGCPWCYRIEPTLSTWIKQQGDKIEFSRVPVVFNKDWGFYAKAYYTAHLLGLDAKFNPILFKAVQDNKTKAVNTNQAMIDLFTAQGVDNTTAKSAFENSTTIDMQIKTGIALMSRFHINGVPAVVVNNQYKTDLQMAKGEERLFKVLNFLVAKAASKKPAKTA